MKIDLHKATLNDAEIIWQMQKEAFASLLEKYQDMDTNPANEPIEKIKYRLSQPFTYFYLIKLKNQNVGAIRVVDKRDDTPKRISPLFVLPAFRNKGIAQAAIKCVEEIHGTQNWSLDTILQEKGNCHLYEKMGYHTTGKTMSINERLTLVFYEK